MWHHKQGLTFTRTGYGARIPSPRMVFFNGRWWRVYVRIWSNIGTAYIGKFSQDENIRVQEVQT